MKLALALAVAAFSLVAPAKSTTTPDEDIGAPPQIDMSHVDKHQIAADFFADRGMTSVRYGKFEKALEEFRRSIEVKPTVRAHQMRGALRFKLDDREGGMQDLAACIFLEPDNSDHHVTRAVMRQLLGDHEGAIADYTSVIHLKPEAARSWANRGLAKMNVGELASAEKDLDRALLLKPDYPEGLFNRGVVRHKLRDYEGAMADYVRALELRPGWNDVMVNLRLTRKALAGETAQN